MQLDDLMARIRRLTPSKLEQLDEIVRSLEEKPAPSGSLPPIRGLLRDLGPAPSTSTIDEARREL
jgi:hypothetical protein